jgi:uncharacterized phage-associated protein
MKTIDEIAKIKASLLYILGQFPTGIDFIKLFKIMYFAQQEHLVKYGRGVMGDSFYALKHGPVPSFTYKAIQACQGKIQASIDLNEVAQVIMVEKDKVYARAKADKDEFSTSDIKCLDNAIAKYRDLDSYELSNLSHDNAWKEAYTRSMDDPEKNKITLIDIAIAGHAKVDVISNLRESEQINRVFAY